ncbi:MAG: hypothetical protein AAGF07_04435 [Patescibacteria group bacterium]
MNFTKNTFKQIIFLLTVLGLTVTLNAFSQTSDTTNVDLVITPGSLSIDIPLDQYSFSGVTLGPSSNSNLDIPDVLVTDATGSEGGWNAQCKYSNLTNSGDSSQILLSSDITANIDTATKYFTHSTTGKEVVSGPHTVDDLTEYPSASAISSMSALDQTGESNLFNILTAASGASAGSFTVDLSGVLSIPQNGFYPTPSNKAILAESHTGVVTCQV